jgi:hypothetical protein
MEPASAGELEEIRALLEKKNPEMKGQDKQ